MNIRDFLFEVGTTYDRKLGTGKGVNAQDLLRAAPRHLFPHVPLGWEISGSGGQGSASHTPWVGIFAPSVTTNPHRGLYIVYLFAADLRSVTLALNQGVTDLRSAYGQTGALSRLREEANRILGGLRPSLTTDWTVPMDLACAEPLQRAYEAGAVATRRYDLTDLPSEGTLRGDLSKMTQILESAARVQADNLLSGMSSKTRRDLDAAVRVVASANPVERFKPKDSGEYIAHVRGMKLVKRRDHEALIAQYGQHVQASGFLVNTNVHPRDLTLKKEGVEWLVEAKAIYVGNATQAVREATGQLLTYRHFLYTSQRQPVPHLLALFNEPIGDAFAEFLETVRIGSVWADNFDWGGSPLARMWGVV